MGIFFSIFDGVICPPHDIGGLLSFHVFNFYLPRNISGIIKPYKERLLDNPCK